MTRTTFNPPGDLAFFWRYHLGHVSTHGKRASYALQTEGFMGPKAQLNEAAKRYISTSQEPNLNSLAV